MIATPNQINPRHQRGSHFNHPEKQPHTFGFLRWQSGWRSPWGKGPLFQKHHARSLQRAGRAGVPIYILSSSSSSCFFFVLLLLFFFYWPVVSSVQITGSSSAGGIRTYAVHHIHPSIHPSSQPCNACMHGIPCISPSAENKYFTYWPGTYRLTHIYILSVHAHSPKIADNNIIKMPRPCTYRRTGIYTTLFVITQMLFVFGSGHFQLPRKVSAFWN